MSINSSIKKGKDINDSNARLADIYANNSRMRRENIIKKKRSDGSFLDVYNRSQNTNYTIQDVINYTECILNPNSSFESLIESVQFFRKVLSNDKAPPIDLVIKQGIVPQICQFLTYDNCHELQYESSWVITNICSGNKEQTSVAVDSHAIPNLLRLLDCPYPDLIEQATWALGNIAGDSVGHRDAIINSGKIDSIIRNMTSAQSTPVCVRNCVWLVSNLCRIRDGVHPDFEKVKVCLPYMQECLMSNDDDIIVDACWCFAFITDSNKHNVNYIVQMNVIPSIIQLMRSTNTRIITPALRTMGNILAGDDTQTQICIDYGIIPALVNLLHASNFTLVKETLWCISNICAGNKQQIDDILNENLLPVLINFVLHERQDIQRESCWCLCNIVCGGDLNQIYQFIQCENSVEAVCQLIRNGEDKKLLSIIIESLDRCISYYNLIAQQQQTPNAVLDRIEDCKALDSLEILQITDDMLQQRVDHFIEKYFGFDDDTLADF